MPFSQSVVEWPAALNHLLEGASIGLGDKRSCRIDVDVGRETLLRLAEFQAHLRHCPVRLRPAGSAHSVVGEMNPLIGLGAGSDPARHVGKVRISFCGLQDEDRSDET